MREPIRWIVRVGLIPTTLLLSGCLFGIFRTARPVRGGDVALVLGTGFMSVSVDEGQPLWTLTPRARLTLGLSERVNLESQTGLAVPLASGSPRWMGASGNLKFSIVDDSDSLSPAVGFGGGSSIELLGWGVFGEIFLDRNLLGFPFSLAYQPTVSRGGEGFAVWHRLAVGPKLRLTARAQPLVQVDLWAPLLSFGFAVDIGRRFVISIRGSIGSTGRP